MIGGGGYRSTGCCLHSEPQAVRNRPGGPQCPNRRPEDPPPRKSHPNLTLVRRAPGTPRPVPNMRRRPRRGHIRLRPHPRVPARPDRLVTRRRVTPRRAVRVRAAIPRRHPGHRRGTRPVVNHRVVRRPAINPDRRSRRGANKAATRRRDLRPGIHSRATVRRPARPAHRVGRLRVTALPRATALRGADNPGTRRRRAPTRRRVGRRHRRSTCPRSPSPDGACSVRPCSR
jgi:hypothetical protein